MNTKRNILPMLLAALLLFCLPMASLAEDVPIQNVSIRNTPIKGQILRLYPGYYSVEPNFV